MLRYGRALSQAAAVAALVIAVQSVPPAAAQTYPDRPIRLVIPFAAGGPNDLIGRPLAEKMSEALGQPIVIENKGGADGIDRHDLRGKGAARRLHDADDDRLVHRQSVAISANPTYNPLTDFAPVTLMAQSYGIVLMTRPDFPAKTLHGIRRARQESRASSATAMPASATSPMWRRSCSRSSPASSCSRSRTGARPRSRPTSCPAMSTSASCRRCSRCRTCKAASCARSASAASQRAPTLPDAPTFQELGFKEMDVTGYFGLWFPARTPRERIALIHREAVKALETPLLKKVLADSGVRAIGSTPEEFARFLRRTCAGR